MIFIVCAVHGMSGKFLGVKMYACKGTKNTTVTIFKKLYTNIVKVDGKLKQL